MSLREMARNAWFSSQDNHIQGARTHLATVIDPYDVSDLDVEFFQIRANVHTTVFGDSDVFLCVANDRTNDSWTVVVTELRDGEWTKLSEPINSLSELGSLLAPGPNEEDPGYPEWAVGIMVAVGDRYVYEGDIYEVRQSHMTQADWTPPNTPALWLKVV
jgi:hypothetical protein